MGEKILKRLSKSKNYRKVRYHCHFTGKYRVAAHSTCNLKFNVLMNSLSFFIMVKIMIIILSLKN